MITEPLQPNAEPWPCDNFTYHSERDHVSHSALDCFRVSPALYHGRYVSGIYSQPPTPEMEFGSMVHEYILEGKTPAIAPVCDRRTKDGKIEYAAFLNRSAGKTVVTSEEWDLTRNMAVGISDNPIAKTLLDSVGEVELGIKWTCEVSGLRLKCRPDKFMRSTNVVLDLKTCREVNPQAFAAMAYRLGYQRQAAFYLDGLQKLTGDSWRMVFVAVQKSPPYTCLVAELDEEFVAAGRTDNLAALDKLAKCRAANKWQDETCGQIVTLSAPRWAKYESEWSL